jgi:tetratricopeptide (TPR) repeat protein
MGLAGIALSKSRLQEAEKDLREALAVTEQVVADYPQEPDYRLLVVTTGMSLAGLLEQRGQCQEAAALVAQAAAGAKKLVEDFPQVVVYRFYRAQGRVALGHLHWAAGRRVEAEQAYREARDHLEQMVSDFKDISYPMTYLAELLTTCPVEALRNPKRAAEVAKQAAALAPAAQQGGPR